MNKPGFLSLSPAAVPSSLLQKGVQLIFSTTEKKKSQMKDLYRGKSMEGPHNILIILLIQLQVHTETAVR